MKYEATGINIWKLHTGKLEIADMRSLNAGVVEYHKKRPANDEFNGDVPISFCKWIQFTDKTSNNYQRKAFLMAGIDRTIRFFL